MSIGGYRIGPVEEPVEQADYVTVEDLKEVLEVHAGAPHENAVSDEDMERVLRVTCLLAEEHDIVSTECLSLR